jgi:hypothetical protein
MKNKMNVIKITKSDLDKGNYYKEDGIGTYDNYADVSVEIAENLGYVKFKKGLYVNFSITALAGSGIEAGRGIKAGWGIEAGSGIKAGEGIEAGSGIKAGEGIEAGRGIKAGWGIEAGSGIKAGEGIKAGWGIEAGWGIKAGWGIEAGWGIVSLYSYIKAKLAITFSTTISAGIFSISGEKEIEAQEINGKVIYGTVNLIPKEEEKALSGQEVEVTIGDKKYVAIIK